MPVRCRCHWNLALALDLRSVLRDVEVAVVHNVQKGTLLRVNDRCEGKEENCPRHTQSNQPQNVQDEAQKVRERWTV